MILEPTMLKGSLTGNNKYIHLRPNMEFELQRYNNFKKWILWQLYGFVFFWFFCALNGMDSDRK